MYKPSGDNLSVLFPSWPYYLILFILIGLTSYAVSYQLVKEKNHMDSILLLNAYITIFMFSVILMTQIVSYPLLKNVDNITFLKYHNFM